MKGLKPVLLFSLIFGICLQSYSEKSSTYQQALEQLEVMGELYFKFEINSSQDVFDLSDVISIDRVKSKEEVFAFANKVEFENFRKYNLDYEVLTPPCMEGPKPVMSDYSDPRPLWDWTKYPTYAGTKTILEELEAAYPDKVKMFKIGESVRGRDILVIKVSANVDQTLPKAAKYFSGAPHGNETAGTMSVLQMTEWLCENYSTDPQAKEILDSMEVWINPWHNPDGTYYGGNNDISRARRLNINGIDLNRNYPKVPGAGTSMTPEQEHKVQQKFAEEHHCVMVTDFHAGVETAIYPYSAISRRTPDDRWWKYVCRVYADLAQADGPTGYYDGCDDGICNGYADLGYVAKGTTKDWYYYYEHIRGISNEYTNVKFVPENQLVSYWNYNRRALLAYTLEARNGIRGFVMDSIRQIGLYAKVFVEDHDRVSDSSWMYSDWVDGLGDYYRPIYAGTYDVTYSAPDCISKTVSNIQVSNGQATVVNVELDCGGTSIELDRQTVKRPISVMPFNNGVRISWGDLKGKIRAAVYDMSGKLIGYLKTRNGMQDNTTVWDGTGKNGAKVSAGCYVVHVNSAEGTFTRPFMIQ
jgi:hypothetical protein